MTEASGKPAGDTHQIPREPLHKEVVARIRRMIVEGELAPGARIPERVLCERFGISRTPLREALKVLAWEGLLELHPNRGAVVAEVSTGDVDEVFPVMEALEALAGELACRNITDREISDLHALHEQMLAHYRKREADPYLRINEKIHNKILDASRNAILIQTYGNLSGRVRRMRYIAELTPDRWQRAVSEHEAMMEALDRRDGRALARVLHQHLRTKLETVKHYLAVRGRKESMEKNTVNQA